MTDETRLKRLRYQSWHRGCKETDTILGQFCDRHLEGLSPPLLDLYERMLQEDDADIWQWLTGKDAPERYEALLNLMKSGS